jgi:hydroxysqualene dehydroxylase
LSSEEDLQVLQLQFISPSKNIKVDLFEASPKLGGRAYSFLAKDGNTIIDNGQHILMGCYNETLRFMKIIGAQENLIYQPSLEINFLKENFEIIKLKSASFPYPFNLMLGILNYGAVSFVQRLKVLQFFIKLFTYSEQELIKLNVSEWLLKEKQNGDISKSLWEIISIGALNTSVKKASAKVFSDILKEIFFKGTFASTIILPNME